MVKLAIRNKSEQRLKYIILRENIKMRLRVSNTHNPSLFILNLPLTSNHLLLILAPHIKPKIPNHHNPFIIIIFSSQLIYLLPLFQLVTNLYIDYILCCFRLCWRLVWRYVCRYRMEYFEES